MYIVVNHEINNTEKFWDTAQSVTAGLPAGLALSARCSVEVHPLTRAASQGTEGRRPRSGARFAGLLPLLRIAHRALA